VINELMYNPPDPGPGILTQNELEFIELYNVGLSAVDMWRSFPGEGDFGWWLNGGIAFEFAVGTTIPSDGYLLVVSFDPVAEPTKLAAFESHYGLDPGTPIVGPYPLGLNDFSEKVALRRPDEAGGGVAPLVIWDDLTYFDFDEWPTEPDGGGPSLERIDPEEVGDLATNWDASEWSGGTPGAVNSVPEPGEGLMLAAGIALLRLLERRRRGAPRSAPR
jgi:hypothetical protein